MMSFEKKRLIQEMPAPVSCVLTRLTSLWSNCLTIYNEL